MTGLLLLSVFLCAVLSCVTGAVGYALRDFSKAKLESILLARGREHRLEPLLEHTFDFILIVASFRLVTILLMLGGLLQLADRFALPDWSRYVAALAVAAILSTVFSVGIASSLAKYFGESLIARLDPLLHALRAVSYPILWPMHWIDSAIFHVSPAAKTSPSEQAEQNVQDEILAVVEEGEKEGVVDETDREMIESVMEFKDTTASQIMTARPDIVGVPMAATLADVLATVITSGHSRLPVYEPDLDHIVGVLYARDLLNVLTPDGQPKPFTVKQFARPVNFIPETKSLKDLLKEFRLRKVHMAIVLDEFGGTAGLVTIEDILEELVGDISDEHEPLSPPALVKLSDDTWEVDASTYINEVNSIIGLTLPEDEGYDTLGGYISTVLGHIPVAGETFSTPPNAPNPSAQWDVLTAEPTRVNRLKVTLLRAPEELDENVEATGKTLVPAQEDAAKG